MGSRSVGELGHYGLLPCAWSSALMHDRSGGELGHYGLLPCAWGYALMHDQAVRPAARGGGPGFGHMHLRGLPHYAALSYLRPGRTACAVMPFQGSDNVPSPT